MIKELNGKLVIAIPHMIQALSRCNNPLTEKLIV